MRIVSGSGGDPLPLPFFFGPCHSLAVGPWQARPVAHRGVCGAAARGAHAYWGRVWAARALLYAWHPMAVPAAVAALTDPHWRVREMAAKVCLRRELGEAADALAPLADDPVPRVRVVAARALAMVGEAEHAPALLALLDDPEPVVRHRAEQCLEVFSRRLDRDFR